MIKRKKKKKPVRLQPRGSREGDEKISGCLIEKTTHILGRLGVRVSTAGLSGYSLGLCKFDFGGFHVLFV